jgi:hypothetical protein
MSRLRELRSSSHIFDLFWGSFGTRFPENASFGDHLVLLLVLVLGSFSRSQIAASAYGKEARLCTVGCCQKLPGKAQWHTVQTGTN